jgi:hypothetical protein
VDERTRPRRLTPAKLASTKRESLTKEKALPTNFYISDAIGNPTHYTVKEPVGSVTEEVNDAIRIDTKYVTFTNESDGKQFSVEAKKVKGIKEA